MKWLPIALLASLAACSNIYRYDGGGNDYVVQAGDTLHSIAWAHAVDTRDLTAWNNLSNPDRIYVGQRLALGPRSTVVGNRAAAPAASRPAAQAAAPRPQPQVAAPAWQWPVRGSIVRSFGDSSALSSGVGIAGAEGAQVSAAAPGRVVYAGSGLRDYGQLLIIEHNASWLSAYGHNRQLLVAEGDTVSQGQQIAELGRNQSGAPVLHFEIRRNGDPVDPLRLLP